MSKVGLHDPFGHLKHKLWPKETPGVQLVVWLPTIKIRKSTRFPYVQVVCNILLESSRQGLQLCFRPHLNQRSECKVMRPQSHGSPNFGNFRTPIWESQLWEFQDSHLGVPRQNVIWMWVSWRDTKYTIRGKVVASPKFRPWWVLWVRISLWLVLTSNMFKLCTNQLVVWLV
jgi:hypothetical protein